jgi:hypothetical protein
LAEEQPKTVLTYATPRKRPRRYFNLSPADAELAGCLGGAVGAAFTFGSIVILWIVTTSAASRLMQYLVISMAYGSDRYVAGLRLAKKFRLSDGSTLPGRWQCAYIFGVLICQGVVLFPWYFLLRKCGLVRDDDKPSQKSDV